MAFNDTTWVDGVTISAADLNTAIRDSLRYLKGRAGPVTLENGLILPELSTPVTPASGYGELYFKSDGGAYALNDSGSEMQLSGSGARVFNNANISVANTTVTLLTFNSESFDDDSYHSTSVNTGLFTVPVNGTYLIGACVAFQSNTSGLRLLRINAGGGIVANEVLPPANGDRTIVIAETVVRMIAGSTVSFEVYQSSGGTLTVDAVTAYSPYAWIWRLQ